MDNDFAPASGDTRTVRQRLLLIEGLEEIVVCDRLAAHNVVLVQMTKSVVDLAKAQDIVTVNWQEMGGALEMFRVIRDPGSAREVRLRRHAPASCISPLAKRES